MEKKLNAAAGCLALDGDVFFEIISTLMTADFIAVSETCLVWHGYAISAALARLQLCDTSFKNAVPHPGLIRIVASISSCPKWGMLGSDRAKAAFAAFRDGSYLSGMPPHLRPKPDAVCRFCGEAFAEFQHGKWQNCGACYRRGLPRPARSAAHDFLKLHGGGEFNHVIAGTRYSSRLVIFRSEVPMSEARYKNVAWLRERAVAVADLKYDRGKEQPVLEEHSLRSAGWPIKLTEAAYAGR